MNRIAGILLLAAAAVYSLPADKVKRATPAPIVKPDIADPVPGYLDYAGTCAKLHDWHAHSNGWTEEGVYGKSAKGKDLHYLRVHGQGPTVLVMACIHGNEPLASSVVMGVLGKMLASYGDDPQATDVMNHRDLYFVPVVSPDSYPNSREVDGVDPNRDFPTEQNPNKVSTPSIQALRQFFLQKHFKAALSAHTFGRQLLTPWGDKPSCPDPAFYDRLTKAMAPEGYYTLKASELYGFVIRGSEVDWMWTQGATSLVVELGTHQHVPSKADVQEELRRTYRAFLTFMKASIR